MTGRHPDTPAAFSPSAWTVSQPNPPTSEFHGENLHPQNDEQNWVVVDATNVPLGRLATLIASRIRGKHRPDFTPT